MTPPDPASPPAWSHDGERITMGSVELEFLATPGHTPESISIVVRDLSGRTGGRAPGAGRSADR